MLPKLQRTNLSAVDPHGSSTTSLVIGGGPKALFRVVSFRGHFRQHRMLSEPSWHLARVAPRTAHFD